MRLAPALLLFVSLSSVGAFAQNFAEWTIKTVVDPITDVKRGIAFTASPSLVTLAVKCDEPGDNKVYFSFVSQKYLGGIDRNRFRAVVYRVDKNPPGELNAFYKDTTASIFSVRPHNPAGSFLKEIYNGRSLAVRLTDYDDRVITAIIDLTGADQALKAVASICQDRAMSNFFDE